MEVVIETAEAWQWLRQLPDASVDLVLTDPPYSSGGAFRGDRAGADPRQKYAETESFTADRVGTFTGDNRDQRGFMAWATLWLFEVQRVLVPGGITAAFTDWRQLPTLTDAVQAAGLVWRGIATWHKPAARPNPGFKLDAEYVVWGTSGPIRTDHVVYLDTVWSESPPVRKDRLHLTEKPLGLLERLVTLAPPDGLVVDPFSGSGTTAVACHRQGRRFAGCELDAGIAEVANRRVEREAQQLTLIGLPSCQTL